MPPRGVDLDRDWMPDRWEYNNGLNSRVNDAADDRDKDELSNLAEFVMGTDPRRKDTDRDGLPDGWEVLVGLSPLVADGSEGPGGDPDSDGLTNAQEYAAGRSPLTSDLDADTLPTEWERTHRLDPYSGSGSDGDAGDPDSDGLSNVDEYAYGTSPITADTDADELLDGWEIQHGMSPLVSDAASDQDADGINALHEYMLGSHPLIPDIDGDRDGVPDVWEMYYYRNTDHGATEDTDGDGLKTLVEYAVWSSPVAMSADSDGDGLPDAWEVFYFPDGTLPGADIDTDTLSNLQELSTMTSPVDADTDGDGITDADELQVYFYNPVKFDTDYDGVSDGAEVAAAGPDPMHADVDGDGLDVLEELAAGTNRKLFDTDGDSMPDGWEVSYGLNPLADDAGADPDGDGMTNRQEYIHRSSPVSKYDTDQMPTGWEATYGLNPYIDDEAVDLDGDTLSNLGEYLAGTDPTDDDTDGDGILDGHELAAGLSPLDIDTDTDGLPDWFEYRYGLITTNGEPDDDPDGDGLNNLYEYAYIIPTNVYVLQGEISGSIGLNPISADTDGDTIPDNVEITANLCPKMATDGYSDYDDDGLLAFNEYAGGSDIARPDTDSDGLLDGDEAPVQCSATDPDTDNDGMLDGYEVRYGLNPIVNDSGLDPDLDGASNLMEAGLGSDPSRADTDYDGLLDFTSLSVYSGEARYAAWAAAGVHYTQGTGVRVFDGESAGATSPTKADTDGDGLLDGYSRVVLRGAAEMPYTNWLALGILTVSNSCTYALFWGELTYSTDPLDADTDGDGMPDGYEAGCSATAVLISEDFVDTTGWTTYGGEAYGEGVGEFPEKCGEAPPALVLEEGEYIISPAVTGPTQLTYHADALSYPCSYAIETSIDGGVTWQALKSLSVSAAGNKQTNVTCIACPSISFVDSPSVIFKLSITTAGHAVVLDDVNILGTGDAPVSPNSTDDDDMDGISNGVEYAQRTRYNCVDSDMDGALDGSSIAILETAGDQRYTAWAAAGIIYTEDEVSPGVSRRVFTGEATEGTAPASADTDGDGLLDYYSIATTYNTSKYAAWKPTIAYVYASSIYTFAGERTLGTLPLDVDFDNDRLLDGPSQSPTSANVIAALAAANIYARTVGGTTTYLGESLKNGTGGAGTSPLLADSDMDTLPDGWEYYYQLNPLSAAPGDFDYDGLLDVDEYARTTAPDNQDTDGDRVTDYAEIVAGTNPLVPTVTDADVDGLSAVREDLLGTSDSDTDSDDDGFSDAYEALHFALKPNAANNGTDDFDNDGLTAIEERDRGTDPDRQDTDGDGMPDGWEVAANISPLVGTGTNGPTGDTDGDGVVAIDEYRNGTSATTADTDGDGLTDAYELKNALDPHDDGGAMGQNTVIVIELFNPTSLPLELGDYILGVWHDDGWKTNDTPAYTLELNDGSPSVNTHIAAKGTFMVSAGGMFVYRLDSSRANSIVHDELRGAIDGNDSVVLYGAGECTPANIVDVFTTTYGGGAGRDIAWVRRAHVVCGNQNPGPVEASSEWQQVAYTNVILAHRTIPGWEPQNDPDVPYTLGTNNNVWLGTHAMTRDHAPVGAHPIITQYVMYNPNSSEADPDGDGRDNLTEQIHGTRALVYDFPAAPFTAARRTRVMPENTYEHMVNDYMAAVQERVDGTQYEYVREYVVANWGDPDEDGDEVMAPVELRNGDRRWVYTRKTEELGSVSNLVENWIQWVTNTYGATSDIVSSNVIQAYMAFTNSVLDPPAQQGAIRYNDSGPGVDLQAFKAADVAMISVLQQYLSPDWREYISRDYARMAYSHGPGAGDECTPEKGWHEYGTLEVPIEALTFRVYDGFRAAGLPTERFIWPKARKSSEHTQVYGWKVGSPDYVVEGAFDVDEHRLRALWYSGSSDTNITVLYRLKGHETVNVSQPEELKSAADFCVVGPGGNIAPPLCWASPSRVLLTAKAGTNYNDVSVMAHVGFIGGEPGVPVTWRADNGFVLEYAETSVAGGAAVVRGHVTPNNVPTRITVTAARGAAVAECTIDIGLISVPEQTYNAAEVSLFSTRVDPAGVAVRVGSTTTARVGVVTTAAFNGNWWGAGSNIPVTATQISGNIQELSLSVVDSGMPGTLSVHKPYASPVSCITAEYPGGKSNWAGVVRVESTIPALVGVTHVMNITAEGGGVNTVRVLPETLKWTDRLPVLEARPSYAISDEVSIDIEGVLVGTAFCALPSGAPAVRVGEEYCTVQEGEATVPFSLRVRGDDVVLTAAAPTLNGVPGYWVDITDVTLGSYTRLAYGPNVTQDMTYIDPAEFPALFGIEFGYFTPYDVYDAAYDVSYFLLSDNGNPIGYQYGIATEQDILLDPNGEVDSTETRDCSEEFTCFAATTLADRYLLMQQVTERQIACSYRQVYSSGLDRKVYGHARNRKENWYTGMTCNMERDGPDVGGNYWDYTDHVYDGLTDTYTVDIGESGDCLDLTDRRTTTTTVVGVDPSWSVGTTQWAWECNIDITDSAGCTSLCTVVSADAKHTYYGGYASAYHAWPQAPGGYVASYEKTETVDDDITRRYTTGGETVTYGIVPAKYYYPITSYQTYCVDDEYGDAYGVCQWNAELFTPERPWGVTRTVPAYETSPDLIEYSGSRHFERDDESIICNHSRRFTVSDDRSADDVQTISHVTYDVSDRSGVYSRYTSAPLDTSGLRAEAAGNVDTYSYARNVYTNIESKYTALGKIVCDNGLHIDDSGSGSSDDSSKNTTVTCERGFKSVKRMGRIVGQYTWGSGVTPPVSGGIMGGVEY